MTYKEYAPSLHLSPFIEKFWTMETDAFDRYPIEFVGIPNGTESFIISLLSGYNVVVNNKLFDIPKATVLMPYSLGKLIVTDNLKVVGVSFKAGSMHALLKSPMGNILSQVIELEAFLGSKAVRVLLDRVAETTLEKGILILEQFFSNYFFRKPYHMDTLGWAVQLIRQSNGNLPIERVAVKLGISRQAIARQFAEKVGVSPKYYSRIIHFDSAFQFLKKNPNTSWLDLTYRFDYFDQSHMIKDFYNFTGTSPKGYTALASSAHDKESLADLNFKLL